MPLLSCILAEAKSVVGNDMFWLCSTIFVPLALDVTFATSHSKLDQNSKVKLMERGSLPCVSLVQKYLSSALRFKDSSLSTCRLRWRKGCPVAGV